MKHIDMMDQDAKDMDGIDKRDIIYNCDRGCSTERTSFGELLVDYIQGACKLSVFDWMKKIRDFGVRDLIEVRFKNTRKMYYENTSGMLLKQGDIVVVEAQAGHDVGIVTLLGPVVLRQLIRNKINPKIYEFKKVYRKAKPLDTERWQEAIAREHDTMIQARHIANDMDLKMKIGDVEFQGDGTKAIFYYIADERVDFRQLIKVFAEKFKIRIEMRQIGARQEAGLIGGIGVCGRPLCCSCYMSNFHSITTTAARVQDLSLNPQKLAGQCGKLKCCINYELSTYADARARLPHISAPLELEDGQAFLKKTDILKGEMSFSYDPHSMVNLTILKASKVRDILKLNAQGKKATSILISPSLSPTSEFIDAVGDENIDRFDKFKKKKTPNNFRKSKQRFEHK